jgi:hypothetical protein
MKLNDDLPLVPRLMISIGVLLLRLSSRHGPVCFHPSMLECLHYFLINTYTITRIIILNVT